jgi:hypothetical protein
LLLAAIQNSDHRSRRYGVTLLASFFGLIALSYPLYATLKGELFPGSGHVSLIGEAIVQLVTRKSSGSILDPHSPAHGIVMFWLHLDPWLLGAAALLCPIAIWRRSTRAVAVAFLIQVLLIVRSGYLPYMYVLGLLPFAAIMVTGAAEAIWRFATTTSEKNRCSDNDRSRMTAARAWARLLPGARITVAAAFGIVLAASVLVVRPRWARTDGQAMTVQMDGPRLAAEQWLVRNMDRKKRLLVPDQFWIYLIEHGFDNHPVFGGSVKGGFYSRTVVFYWPVDYDPAIQRYFPHGWEDFDYVVSTDSMRNDTKQVPTTAKALEHSRVVVTFGAGRDRIEIRQIERPQGSAPTDRPT